MADPVCTRCNDTHRMELDLGDGEIAPAMCTSCPVPCQKCRAGGIGAFCERTPCSCECHGKIQVPTELERAVRLVQRELERLKVRSVTFTDAAVASVRVEQRGGPVEWHGCLWHAVQALGGGDRG